MENAKDKPKGKPSTSNPKVRPDDARGTPRGAGTIENPTGGRIGNPPHVVTDEKRLEVRTFAKVTSQAHAAAQMKISISTLRRHYQQEWDEGQAEAVATVGAKLLQLAMKGDRTCMIFYLRTKGKGAYSARIEHTGAEGAPIEHKYDFSVMTDEQRAKYEEMCRDVAGLDPDESIDVG